MARNFHSSASSLQNLMPVLDNCSYSEIQTDLDVPAAASVYLFRRVVGRAVLGAMYDYFHLQRYALTFIAARSAL